MPIEAGKMETTREANWDNYWLKAQGKRQRGLYERLAEFYRCYLIAPLGASMLSRYFPNESGKQYLHAGCGSGGSDQRITLDCPVFHSLDLSFTALTMNKQQVRGTNRRFICGNLFFLPYKSGTIDGIFNFGVMEHFVERDIEKILAEFHRVLKSDGNVILFWPPNFGLSVVTLTSCLWLLNKFRKQSISLYPDEVSRIKSFKWVRGLMTRNNFKVIKTHFGAKDLFTFVVVVAQKA